MAERYWELRWRTENAEKERLQEFVNWVDSWVSNPVGSYSVSALDGLFGMTRDRIAKLARYPQETGE